VHPCHFVPVPLLCIHGTVVVIQGDSAGKVSILAGDRIGHSEKQRPYERLSNYEWLPRQSYVNAQIPKPCEL